MTNIIICIVTALCFAMWPILLNKSGTPNMSLATIVVMITTLLPMIIYNQITSIEKTHLSAKYILIAALIGLINGIGMIFYMQLIKTSQPGLYVSIVAATMPVMGLVLGYIIVGQPSIITITKIVGIIIIALGVWMVTK